MGFSTYFGGTGRARETQFIAAMDHWPVSLEKSGAAAQAICYSRALAAAAVYVHKCLPVDRFIGADSARSRLWLAQGLGRDVVPGISGPVRRLEAALKRMRDRRLKVEERACQSRAAPPQIVTVMAAAAYRAVGPARSAIF